MKILLVEDEPRVAELLRRALVDESHDADVAEECESGERMALSAAYDMLVLDRMLPNGDGLAICRNARLHGIQCPILILTARDAVEDRIAGLDSGADDYLVKPFAIGEFLARIRALLRRGATPATHVLEAGTITVDPVSRRVRCGGSEIVLTDREFRLLEYMIRNKGRTLTRAEIAESAWSTEVDNGTNAVDVYVNFLRNKSDVLRSSIQTVRGEGYRLGDAA